MVHRYKPALALGVLALLVCHCGGDDEPPARSADQATEVMTPASRTLTEEESRSPTDARVAALADATNNGIIEQAKVAWGRALNQELRQFAHQQVVRHRDATLGQSRVESGLGLTPIESEQSTALDARAQEEVARLLAVDQREFDATYLESQLRWHDDALLLYDNELVPEAEDPMLKAALGAQRALLASQRQQLSQLLSLFGRPPFGPNAPIPAL